MNPAPRIAQSAAMAPQGVHHQTCGYGQHPEKQNGAVVEIGE